MRDHKIRLAVLMVLALASFTSSRLWADAPRSIWPSYHMDMLRQGLNPKSLDISNPASLNLIWVFPRATQEAVQEEYKFISDDKSPLFTGIGSWRQGYDANAWGYTTAAGAQEQSPYSYLWASSVNASVPSSGPIAKAVWRFPTEIPKGQYQVWVWVPPVPTVDPLNPAVNYKYTTKARYQVFDALGQSTAVFDQTQGGTWQLLSTNPYQFTGNGDLRIELTNLTTDETDSVRVAADAIKFVPVTGQQIYSSPTSAEIDFNYKLSDGNLWSGRIPVVYAGTVEPPFVRSGGALDTGSIYCINSITPDNQTYTIDTTHEELSKLLGTPVWRYPGYQGLDLESLTSDQVAEFLAKKNCGIIGPMEGGIHSSVTLAHVPSLQTMGADQFIAIVTGIDRQVYAFDAENGDLLFKGPGVTLSETNQWTTEPAVASSKLRNDAFGGQYHWTQVGSGADMVWDFSSGLGKTGGLGASRSYAVYAWIPVAKGDEPTRTDANGNVLSTRITDAVYTITYSGGTATAKANQRRAANQGSWVKLGSWFGVQKVSLSTAKDPSDPSDSIVVADAVMVVPDTIGSFSYCTAATNVCVDPEDIYEQNGNYRATTAFACTATGGRLVSFDLQKSLSNASNGDPIASVNWVYPDIRSTSVITDPNNNTGGDQPDMGEIGASPTYYEGLSKKMVYVPTLSGTIHCVNALTGDLLGKFTAPSTSSTTADPAPNTPPGELTGTAGFTSSATIGQTDSGKKCLFIGSVDGTFYALDPETLEQLNKLPTNPYGAFRFSTPSTVHISTADARVWAASSDGSIYALKANNPTANDFLNPIPDSTAMPVFKKPSTLSTIQSSPAFDGYGSSIGKNFITMYVGDMNGALHWYDAMTGHSDWYFNPDDLTNPTDTAYNTSDNNFTSFQCDGALFSSPNVTSFRAPMSAGGTLGYVYTGCSDGRIYALSQYGGAWGGLWAGGYWPFNHGHPNDWRQNSNTRLAPDTDVQVDIFHQDFYDTSKTEDPEPMDGTNHLSTQADTGRTPWNTKWIVSPTMKMPEPSPAFPISDGVTPSQITARNQKIDEYLTKEARGRRVDPFIFSNVNDRSKGQPIYFEWGETLNIVIWNLPALEYLSGATLQSAASSISFSMVNSSPGSSSGTLLRPTGSPTIKEYTVLDKDNPVLDDDKKPIPNEYQPLRYGGTTVVKRCYAVAQIYLDPTRNPPFSPGPGWTLVAEVKRKQTNDTSAPLITQRIPIAVLKPQDGLNVPDFDNPQDLGINNPLAICDDNGGDMGQTGDASIAWPNANLNNAYSAAGQRNNLEAHFNGNAAMDDKGNYLPGNMPFINYKMVNHGSSSREARLFVMDRSAVGTRLASVNTPQKINNFRITGGDLLFRGGSDRINASGGCWLPWEFGPGTSDYPNLYRQRQEMRKASDDGLPVDGNTSLPPVIGGIDPGKSIGDYDRSTLQPETVFSSVDVPRFQPANFKTPTNTSVGPQAIDYAGAGYTRTMSAYIDSNPNGSLDSGNEVLGAPVVYQEVYRRFAVGVMVPPDPKIEVDESIVDEGIGPHALGEAMLGARGFSPFNPAPDIAQWFKPVTIKNAGNVNLPNMQVGRTVPQWDQATSKWIDYPVNLFGDQTSPTAPIPGWEIVSSLDPTGTWIGDPVFKTDPFITSGFGYTLSKARVGEPDPTQMSIPDKRKWDADFAGTKALATTVWDQANDLVGVSPATRTILPLPVEVGVRLPLTQPIGTYQSSWIMKNSDNSSTSVPYVPIYSDRNGNFKVDLSSEPVAQKSFQLKIAVKETQLTGGQTPTSLIQVDEQAPPDAPRFGEGTPAAYRDPLTGNVLMVYSSNFVIAPSVVMGLTAAEKETLPNAPWMLFHALLKFDKGIWQPTGANLDRWWTSPWDASSPFVYPDGWPSPLLGSYSGAEWTKLTWTCGKTTLPSVRHFAPVFVNYTTKDNGKDVNHSWLVWVGSVDVQDTATGKVAQEYRLFYTDTSGCDASRTPKTIDHDPAMVKRYPSVAYDPGNGGRLWTAWQGGEEGKWGLYATVTDDPSDSSKWTSDMKLMVPDCLASVSSPNLLMRPPWSNDLQLVYAGCTKLGQTSDIMLTCYNPVSDIDVKNEPDPAKRSKLIDSLPSNTALTMPRVMDEKLERDSKYGFYNSRHLAWIRPEPGSTLKVDNWGATDHGLPPLPPNFSYAPADYPVIHVVLPVGYPVSDDCPLPSSVVSGGRTTEQVAISGTDGSVWHRASDRAAWAQLSGFGPKVPPTTPAVTMEVDDGTGLYVYKYPTGSVADNVMGQMLVDYSAGIVRVTKTLSEQRAGDKFLSAEVWADYTPRTWRLTTDKAADSSPRAFIEKTQMSCHNLPTAQDPNPGLGSPWRTMTGYPDKDQPVDRLWVFWRKAATGAQSSTIYYATYRAGYDLADLLKRNHVDIDPTSTYRFCDAPFTDPNCVGPWELDGGKTKLFITRGASPATSIWYQWTDSNGAVHTATASGLGYGWVPELKEQSLLGFAADGNVNEGSIYAFADPAGSWNSNGTFDRPTSSKIWLFWTSTRAGTANLFWETFCPDFAAR